MTDVVTTPELAVASPRSIAYLNELFAERYEGTLDASMYQGATQSAISAAITEMLKQPACMAPTEEALSKLASLSSSAVPADTLQGVNRQIRAIEQNQRAERKHASRVAYATSAAEWDSYLTSLTAEQAGADSAALPF